MSDTISLQSFLESLAGSQATLWREDFDLTSLLALSGEALDQAMAALLALPAVEVRVPRALAVLRTPEAILALEQRMEPPFPDPVRAEAAAQRYLQGDRQRSVAVFQEILETSHAPTAITIVAATVRDSPPACLWPGLRGQLDHIQESVRQNCAWALRSALPLPREQQGKRCNLLEVRLGSVLATVRRTALAHYDSLMADLQAGRPVDRWTEALPPQSPALGRFLECLRQPKGPAFDTAGLLALQGIERDWAEHMLVAAVLRGDVRAPAALAELGDFQAELVEARLHVGPATIAAIDRVSIKDFPLQR